MTKKVCNDNCSMGSKRKGPVAMSRWTFWGAGYKEKADPLFCEICKNRVHKLYISWINETRIEVCEECNREDTISDYLKNKRNGEKTKDKDKKEYKCLGSGYGFQDRMDHYKNKLKELRDRLWIYRCKKIKKFK